MSWVVAVDAGVRKQMRRFPAADTDRILAALTEMETDPYAGDIEKLKGQERWKRRVGSYRIFYEIHAHRRVVYVVAVTRRTSSTY